MKKAFTLAEVMIVLTVIGILAGILIPVANNSRPDENVMKFKKAHATLFNVIHELVTSDKYYKNGDLGVRANGERLVVSEEEANNLYFCQTLADVLTTKSVNCTAYEVTGGSNLDTRNGYKNGDPPNYPRAKAEVDRRCLTTQQTVEASRNQIILSDGVLFYEQYSWAPFGKDNSDTGYRIWSAPDEIPRWYDSSGFDPFYKIFCIDVDGYNGPELPFGYGIRADGKIMTGARADEWLEKDFQKGKKDN